MAIDAATTTRPVLQLARVRALPLRLALPLLVGASFAFRLAAALAHATPLYFPDEYIYGALARSIATTGRPAVRGASAHFPPRPTPRAQILFTVVAGLAAFARIQYVVLPAAFACAALVLDRRRAARSYWPFAALLALPGLAVAALGTSRVLGYYSSVGHAHVPVGSALKWAAIDTMMLAYSAGWGVRPGQLVGLAYAHVPPAVRT